MQNNATNSQKGVSLIITFFIMIIVLAVVLSVSIILYSEIKVIRNIGNSVVSFYAADSGVEKVLYYDNKVLPNSPDGTTPVKRGLCTMLDDFHNPEKYCQSKQTGGTDDNGIYCDSPYTTGTNCYPDCTDCQITFKTTFNNKVYYTTAKVYTSSDNSSSNLEIDSKGNFADTGRQIQVLSTAINPQNAIKVEYACFSPKSADSSGKGSIFITATISATMVQDYIDPGTVKASIYDLSANFIDSLPLVCDSGNNKTCGYYGTWTVPLGMPAADYSVILSVKDTDEQPHELNIPLLTCFTQ